MQSVKNLNRISNVKKMIITAVCAALCVVLPFAFHSVPNGGTIFSPIHIPVLLCGLICGWQYGTVCGILGVTLSSVITSMPPAAYLPPMLIECAVYGFMCGLMMKLVKTKSFAADVYISLITSMLAGRVIAGIAKALFFAAGKFTMEAWFTGYFVTSLPGIVLHLILIPAIVFALSRAKLIPERYSNGSKND